MKMRILQEIAKGYQVKVIKTEICLEDEYTMTAFRIIEGELKVIEIVHEEPIKAIEMKRISLIDDDLFSAIAD